MIKTDGRVFGNGYDFWIYVVGEQSSDERSDWIKMGNLVYRKVGYGHDGAVHKSFAFPICDTAGTFYEVLSSNCEECGTVFVSENKSMNSVYFNVPWLTCEQKREIKPIAFASEYVESIENLITKCIWCSPIRKIYIQTRSQTMFEQPNLIGVISCEQFHHMMKNDLLLGNVVYAVSFDCSDTKSKKHGMR